MFNPISSLFRLSSQPSERQRQARDELAKAALPGNKTALFDALAAADIDSVLVLFGGGDEPGQIEYIAALDAKANDALAPLPNVKVPYSRPHDDGSGVKTRSYGVAQIIELLCFDLLGQTHDGWESNASAYGGFYFDVPQRTIGLEFNQLRTETEYFEHNF